MKHINLGGEALSASDIALGCMRINQLSAGEASRLIGRALENGINCFDHADIYGEGTCEEVFARAAGLTPDLRESVILQTKCGIRQGYFDFSRDHILRSAEGSLKRLNTEYIDVYLLHRPDAFSRVFFSEAINSRS